MKKQVAVQSKKPQSKPLKQSTTSKSDKKVEKKPVKNVTKNVDKSTKITVMEGPKEWEAEDDVRTLARAEEIKADKARFERAQKMAVKKVQEFSKVASK